MGCHAAVAIASVSQCHLNGRVAVVIGASCHSPVSGPRPPEACTPPPDCPGALGVLRQWLVRTPGDFRGHLVVMSATVLGRPVLLFYHVPALLEARVYSPSMAADRRRGRQPPERRTRGSASKGPGSRPGLRHQPQSAGQQTARREVDTQLRVVVSVLQQTRRAWLLQ